MTESVVSRRMVIADSTGFVKVNRQSRLKVYDGHLQLTKNWVKNILKSMEWSKRKGTTSKTVLSKQFLLEEKLIFQRLILSIIEENDTRTDHVVNLDQTSLSYVSPGKLPSVQQVQEQC